VSKKEHYRAIFLGGGFATTNVLTKNLKGHFRHRNQFKRSSNLYHLAIPVRTNSPYVITSKTRAEAQFLSGCCDTLSPAS
jgi:hypothetical protein